MKIDHTGLNASPWDGGIKCRGTVRVISNALGSEHRTDEVTVTGVKCVGDRATSEHVGADLEASGQAKYAVTRAAVVSTPSTARGRVVFRGDTSLDTYLERVKCCLANGKVDVCGSRTFNEEVARRNMLDQTQVLLDSIENPRQH